MRKSVGAVTVRLSEVARLVAAIAKVCDAELVPVVTPPKAKVEGVAVTITGGVNVYIWPLAGDEVMVDV